jgi:ubiquinone/menaquinone biosynthesis C-methylase UbiE
LAPHVHPSGRHGDFDAWAPTYDRSPLQRIFFDRVHSRVAAATMPLLGGTATPVIADVGCGTGQLLLRLRAALPSASLVGVDPAAGMISVARSKSGLQGVRLEVGSAEALPLESASCDVVVSTVSFHHWSDQAGGLRDVARVLRPGGHLLLVDFFARGPLGAVVRRFVAGHGSGLPEEGELVRMVNAASLRAESVRRLGALLPLGIMTAARP